MSNGNGTGLLVLQKSNLIFHKCFGKGPSFYISLRGMHCTSIVPLRQLHSAWAGPALLTWLLLSWSCSGCCYSSCRPRAAITGLPGTYSSPYDRWSADITGLAHYLHSKSLKFFWKESNLFILSYTNMVYITLFPRESKITHKTALGCC